MKKKLMMVAVLIGALSLGACVDNKESDSVVAVRTAKAAQLNSIAAMNNAEADCKKAIAAYKKAEAEIMQMKADTTKARLEIDIEAAKINAQAGLEQAKAQLEAAKQTLIEELKKTDIATQGRVSALLTKANELLGTITYAPDGTPVVNGGIYGDRQSLITEKDNLLKLKTGLITAEALNKRKIVSKEQDKAKYQTLVAEYQKYSQEDRTNAIKAAQEARVKANGLSSVSTNATAVFTAAGAAYTAADKLITWQSSASENNCIYLKMWQAHRADGFFKTESVPAEEVEYKNDNGTSGIVTKQAYTKYVAKLDMFNQAVTEKDRLLAVAKLELTEASKALETAKTSDQYKGLLADIAAKQKTYNEAITASDKEQARQALEQAEQAAKLHIKTFEDVVAAKEVNVKTSETGLKTAQEELAGVSGDNEKAYQALVAAFVVARDNKAVAEIAKAKAGYVYGIQNALASALETVVAEGSLVDFATLIAKTQNLIAECDRDIALIHTMTEEQLIADTEVNIKHIEDRLAANEQMYADYMNQIKEILGGNTAE